jgi:hypothetical protein
MAQLSTLPLSQSLVSKTLNARNPFSKVYDISGGYNTFTYFTDMLNPGGSKQVDTVKYEKAKRGNLSVISQIATNSLVGANLVLTFTDPTYNNFRIYDEVMDTERVHGRVVVAGPGTVTLEPIGTAFNAAIHFVANAYCKQIVDASPNRYSVGKSSLYNTPDLDFNYASISRDSNQLARRDKLNTYVEVSGKGWWTDQEIEMIRRIAKDVEKKYIFQERNQLIVNGGETNFNGGLIWSIKNRGGIYIPSTSPLTQTLFQDLLTQVMLQNTNPKMDLKLFYGKRTLQTIQGFTSDFIKYAGTRNTFGVGEGSGLNVMEWAFANAKVDFISLPLFDDTVMFPEASNIPGVFGTRASNSFFLLDASPRPIVGGGFAPAVEKFHFDKEFYYGYIRGMADAGASTSNYMQATESIISSDADGFSCHAMVDNGIDIIDARNMLFYEPAS